MSSDEDLDESTFALVRALGEGDPARVAALLDAGADLGYRRAHGYDALIDAVHGRDVARDPRLLDLLRLLVERGAELSGVSQYGESGLRVLSRLGRFDGVRLLLEAGMDASSLGWTPLMRAVAIGTLADVEAPLAAGADLEARDHYSRTPWLIALLAGSLEKAELLRARGANVDARGLTGLPALAYAVSSHRPEVVRFLLAIGQPPDGADEFEVTPLMTAVEEDNIACIDLLLAAGADANRQGRTGDVLGRARSREAALRLLDAGADPAGLGSSGQRLLVGLPADPDEGLITASREEFRRAPTRRFGATNPERMEEPFWLDVVRSGVSAYRAAEHFGEPASDRNGPVWCAERFGQSITFIPDGRALRIGGEHEDSYDADFCIYNDVFVHHPDGRIEIFGYPADVFPPTDFHTATLLGDFVYLVGSLGYSGARRFGETPVRRLDPRTLRMETLSTTGEAPGWLYGHRATRAGSREIRITGGKVVTAADGREEHTENRGVFFLDVNSGVWRREL